MLGVCAGRRYKTAEAVACLRVSKPTALTSSVRVLKNVSQPVSLPGIRENEHGCKVVADAGAGTEGVFGPVLGRLRVPGRGIPDALCVGPVVGPGAEERRADGAAGGGAGAVVAGVSHASDVGRAAGAGPGAADRGGRTHGRGDDRPDRRDQLRQKGNPDARRAAAVVWTPGPGRELRGHGPSGGGLRRLPGAARWRPVSARELGILLSKVTDIPLPTSLLGMLAGGYAMNVITGDRIKADVRMVTLMHLIRLILVLIATPILIHFFLAPGTHLSLFAGGRSDDTGSFFISFCFTVLVALVGGWLGVKYSYSGSVLLTPLCLMVVLGLIPAFRGIIPPEGFREVATMVIGLQIGLRFNVGVLKRTKKYIPIITALMLVTIIGCGMFAWLLTAVTPMNAITAYLSTTPGGRTAVVSLAFTTGADPTSVLAIQTLRLLIMTILAPAAIGYIVKRRIASVSEDMELLE